MGDRKLALAGLDWLAKLGLPPNLLDNSRAELQAQSGAAAPPTAVPAREPQRVEVTPGNLFVAPGEQAWLAATLIYADGPPDDITADVVWSSSATAFKVDRGLVFAEDLTGYNLSARITATDPKSKLSGFALAAWPSAPVPIGLRIEPDHFKLGADEQIALKAIRTFPGNRLMDASTLVKWTSSQGVVSVDAQGVVTASGITGEQDVVITATDPDAPLTAMATGVISTSHDVTLEITPTTVDLAPGGSVQYKAERVGAGGRQDVTATVDWLSSSALLTISASGVALADAKALKSETVVVTVSDREANLTAKSTAHVNVPSREVRKFKLLDGEIAYFAGYANVVLPRLKSANAAALATEKHESDLDRQYESLMKTKEKVGPSLKNAVADVRRNAATLKADAQSAKHDMLRKEDLQAEVDKLEQQLKDVRSRIAGAASALTLTSKNKRLHDLQAEAASINDDVTFVSDSIKLIAVTVDPTAGIGSRLSAIMDFISTATKRWGNDAAGKAQALQDEIDHEALESAQTGLEEAKKSFVAWLKISEAALTRLQQNDAHAIEHWQAIEVKYNALFKKSGSFSFDLIGEVNKIGKKALSAAKATQDVAELVRSSAGDMMTLDPKPAVWLAQPDRDLPLIETVSSDAAQKLALGKEREGQIIAILAEMNDITGKTRAVLLEPATEEP